MSLILPPGGGTPLTPGAHQYTVMVEFGGYLRYFLTLHVIEVGHPLHTVAVPLPVGIIHIPHALAHTTSLEACSPWLEIPIGLPTTIPPWEILETHLTPVQGMICWYILDLMCRVPLTPDACPRRMSLNIVAGMRAMTEGLGEDVTELVLHASYVNALLYHYVMALRIGGLY